MSKVNNKDIRTISLLSLKEFEKLPNKDYYSYILLIFI